MTIIEIAALADGSHRLQSQSHRTRNWMGEEWVEVPAHLESAVWACYGYCDLTFEGDRLTGVAPIERPESTYVPVPTEEEKLRADVDYLSVMTGVELS